MQHLSLNDINPDNYRYIDTKVKNYSPEKNYAVIAKVLKDNDKMQSALHPDVEKNAGNVADILASFAKYKLDIGGGKQIEEWLGRERMKKIYGDKLLEKIRILKSVEKLSLKEQDKVLGDKFWLK